MKRAYVTEFYNFSSNLNTEYYKLYYDYLVESFRKWYDLVDTAYIIDVNWDFTEEDKQRMWDIKKEVIFYKSPILGHHHRQLAHFLPQVIEDYILVMDNDCFVYDREGVEFFFERIPGKDAVVQFSNNGGLQEAVWNKYPVLKELKAQSLYPNNICFSREFISNKRHKEWHDTINYPEGTYIKELDYITKKGDWNEGHSGIVWGLAERDNFVSFEPIPNQGFHHLHSVSWAYLLLSYKKLGGKDNLQRYWEFIKGQPIEKSLKIMNWFMTIDIENKYTIEIKAVIQDILFNKVHSFQ